MIASSTATWISGKRHFNLLYSQLFPKAKPISMRSASTCSTAVSWFEQSRLVRVAGKEEESIVDGPGLRYVLFVQGCPINCPGCQNPSTHDATAGESLSLGEIMQDIHKNPLIHGVTFSGGEPFCQSEVLAPLAMELKRQGYHLMSYTGYLMEDLLRRVNCLAFLRTLDILVDGPFVLSKRSLELKFRGSSNQRVIDVPASLQKEKIITLEL